MIFESIIQALWGCMPEIASDCIDMTNSSSTYFSIGIGAIIGGIVSWWIYDRQNKTSRIQEQTLEKIQVLGERHDKLLNKMEQIEQHHQMTLDAILELEKKLADIIDKNVHD